MTLGRDKQCDIILDNPRISRQHASLRWQRGLWMIENLSQTSYVVVDKLRTTQSVLQHNNVVQLGSEVSFVFLIQQPVAGGLYSSQPGGMSATPIIPAPELLGPLRRRQALERATVISFDAEWLAPVKQADRRLRIGLLADQWDVGLPEQACQLGAAVLILAVEIMALSRIEAAQDAGLEVWTYTANDAGLVAACAAMGATGIITNRPDLIRTKQV